MDNINVNPGTNANKVSVATDDIGGTHYPIYKTAFGADGSVTPVSAANPLPITDYWLQHAADVIFSTYGHTIDVYAKSKDLLKFGHSTTIGTTQATIAHQPAGILHETYVTSDLINTIISTDPGDTQEVVIEGHTLSGSDYTFVVQTVTLTGQTAVALTTPLARVSRVYNNGTADMVGTISVTETDTYVAGVPQTDTKVHLQIEAGENQSEKAATTISSTDYWILTSFSGDMLKKVAAFAEVELQTRINGFVFRPINIISCTDGGRGIHEFKPYIIIRPNSDVRLAARASGADTPVAGSIQGVLASIV